MVIQFIMLVPQNLSVFIHLPSIGPDIFSSICDSFFQPWLCKSILVLQVIQSNHIDIDLEDVNSPFHFLESDICSCKLKRTLNEQLHLKVYSQMAATNW